VRVYNIHTVGCLGSRFFEPNRPKQSDQKYILCFFVYDSDPTKELFHRGPNITKI